MDHFTKEQEQLFKKAVAAIKSAERAGLCFYGKGDHLRAYRAIDIAKSVPFTERHMFGEVIPCLSARILCDSGSDDEEYFYKK